MYITNNKVIFYWTILIFNLCISSCNDHPEPKEIIQEKEVMEEVQNDTAIHQLEEKILGLTQKNNSEKQTIKSLNSQVRLLHAENDDLKTTIHQKNAIISKLTTKDQPQIAGNELQIRLLIQNLNKAWVDLPRSESTDEFLALFLPQFAVSMVSIRLDDKAEVKTLDRNEFAALLEKVRKRDNLTIQIGNVNFVYFNGRNNLYSIVYTAILRSYEDEVASMDRSFVATITVKKHEGQWLIGKYSWAAMHQDLKQ